MGPKQGRRGEGKSLQTFRLENVFFGATLCPLGALAGSITPQLSRAPPPPDAPPLGNRSSGAAPRSQNCVCSRLFPFPEQQRPRPHAALLPAFARLGGFCPQLQGRGGWAHGPLIDTNLLTSGLRATSAVFPSEHVPAV